MKIFRYILIFSFTSFFSLITYFNICFAQYNKQIDSLSILYNRATSDSAKVIALGKLADYYYLYNLNRQGDSVLYKQFMVADLSNNSNLILLALFGDAITNVSPNTTSENFDKTIQFVEKGINYAMSQNKFDYIALGYTRQANIFRKRGQNDKSLNAANIAAQYLSNIVSDSVKAVIYIQLGNSYQANNQSVLASTNYNRAFDIALKIKSIPLQSDIYHCFSEMYSSLGNNDEAKEELKKSFALNKENKYGEGMVRDYFDLARITEEKFFIDKTIELSDSLHLNKYILKAKGLMLAYYEVIEKNSDKALKYLDTEIDLKHWYLNTGEANYHEAIGNIYYYSNKVDSALYYFKLAEYDYLKNYDQKLSQNIFWEIALCYEALNDISNAIAYYTKVLALSKKMNDASAIAEVSLSLSNLYGQQNDFKQAFVYSKLSIEYKDSLRNLSKGRDLALLDVDRETRKHQEALREEQQRLKRKRDIQYMAITIVISIIFLCMLAIGMFPVSKLTIKILGYFFFISLFEFIVLLIDNVFLASATHGEPLKLWLIKIALIAMLVPLQHFLEHNLIRFLESRKLLEARTKFSFTKWLKKIKKPLPQSETKLEEDTAVL